MAEAPGGLRPDQAVLKRSFDLATAVAILLCTWWLIVLAWAWARWETGASGFFRQDRVGRGGRIFRVVKIRTMRAATSDRSSVTVRGDSRVTRSGAVFRRWRIDELPQCFNVILGDMSIVGPRPDVPGFADLLEGDDRIVLTVRPGITGPATIKYREEESLLALTSDPERFNREVLFPDKTRINSHYVKHWSLGEDLRCVWRTVFPGRRSAESPLASMIVSSLPEGSRSCPRVDRQDS